MVVVSGVVRLQSGKRDQAIDLARWMMAETAKEDGCLVYRFSSDLTDPDLLYVYEEWASEEALAAHGESAHMARFRERLPEFVTAPPDIRRLAVTQAG